MTWATMDCIEKKRIHKRYRIKELNKTLVYQRTSKEAKLLCKAKLIGLHVPTVYFVTPDTIFMEYISGLTMQQVIAAGQYDQDLMTTIGEIIGILHNNDIVHGDLSPMNIIIHDKQPYLIDFGLSFTSHTIEDFAVDLVAFEKVIGNDLLFNYILDGYYSSCKQNISKRIDQVRLRGRKK